jgi:hypothetical protein
VRTVASVAQYRAVSTYAKYAIETYILQALIASMSERLQEVPHSPDGHAPSASRVFALRTEIPIESAMPQSLEQKQASIPKASRFPCPMRQSIPVPSPANLGVRQRLDACFCTGGPAVVILWRLRERRAVRSFGFWIYRFRAAISARITFK